MNHFNKPRMLHRQLKTGMTAATLVCGLIGCSCNVASAQQNQPFKASSGGGGSGSHTSPYSSTSGGNGELELRLDNVIKEGVSPGMSYAVMKTAGTHRFVYFVMLLHKYSEDADEIPFKVWVFDGKGEIKESFKISGRDCSIAYSVVVDDQAGAGKQKETLTVQGKDVNLSQGRLLVIDMTGDAVVVEQAAIPLVNVPENSVERAAKLMLHDVSQSLKDGALKAQVVIGKK